MNKAVDAQDKRTVTDLMVGPFHASHARDATFEVGMRDTFEYRDLGIAEATGGKVLAQVIRTRGKAGGESEMHTHDLDFHMVYILKGKATFYFEDVGNVEFTAGSCWYQRPGIAHKQVSFSDDFEVLEITIPAEFRTSTVAP